MAYKTQLAGEGDDETYIPAGVQITFDDTIVNYGNGFDIRTNEFVAPNAGTYVFFFSSECMDTTIHCHTELRVNNQPVSGLHDDVSSEIVAHQTAWFSVQRLSSGDTVTVHTEDNEFEDQVLYYAHNDITFYGYLLE